MSTQSIFAEHSISDVRAIAISEAQRLIDEDKLVRVTIDVGEPVAVAFENFELAEKFIPSISHLIAPDAAAPALTIVVADSNSLGPLPPTVSDLEGLPRASGYQMDDLGAFATDPNLTISAVDWQSSLGIWWLDAERGTSSWQISAPFRQILAWWAPRSGQVLTHAAVVGNDERGVMITAPGGCGKSTTTMQCGVDGLRILSDDYCITRPGERPIARAATRCAKLSDTSLELLGTHVGAIDNSHRFSNDEKNLVYLPLDGPAPAVSRLEIVAVVVPSIGDEPFASIEPTSGSLALSSLAMSSIFQFNASPSILLPACRDIIDSVPTYNLRLGRDLSSSTPLLADLLS